MYSECDAGINGLANGIKQTCLMKCAKSVAMSANTQRSCLAVKFIVQASHEDAKAIMAIQNF